MRITRRQTLGAGLAIGATAPLSKSTFGQRLPTLKGVDVLIIGAGLSGLNAALILEEEGYTVQVVEGQNRIGGRVKTLSSLPGHPEVGANYVGGGYGRVIDMADRLGVMLKDYIPRLMMRPDIAMFLDNMHVPEKAWPDHPRNPFLGNDKTIMPWRYLPSKFASINPLNDPADWIDPQFSALDISYRQFLLNSGLSDQAIELSFDTNPGYGSSSFDVSALMMLFARSFERQQAMMAPVQLAAIGGNQRLPEAMAGQLKSEVHLAKKVVAVSSEQTGTKVSCSDGSKYTAKRVICSVPFVVARDIRFDPILSGRQAEAVKTLPQMAITQVHFIANRKFWDDDGLNPTMWTDGPAGIVVAQRFGETDDDVTSFIAWARGVRAQQLDRLGKETSTKLVLDSIEQMRPAAKGHITAVGYHSWALDPFSGGDWAVFAPGQVSRFAGHLATPHDRIHFCGEHTATDNRGMEGAMASGERAAFEVLDLL